MKRFTVEVMPGRRTVLTVMIGLFSPKDAADLIEAYTKLLDQVGFAPGTFNLIVDVSTSPIQPADIVQNLSAFLTAQAHKPARIAFVHGDNVSKMQARRVSADHLGQHFATLPQALEWLT